MADYMHPCVYCEELIPSESQICPLCGKSEPLGLLRCASCKAPVEAGSKSCPQCGESLEMACIRCGEQTFVGQYCEHCGGELEVVCGNCQTRQPLGGKACKVCGKPL